MVKLKPLNELLLFEGYSLGKGCEQVAQERQLQCPLHPRSSIHLFIAVYFVCGVCDAGAAVRATSTALPLFLWQ